jgi:HSP20 family protein
MFSTERGFGTWDPFREFERVLDDVNRAFARGRTGIAGSEPPINVWANDESVMLTAQLPGIEPGGIEISVVGDTVTLSGKRSEPDRQDGGWLRRERGDLAFTRSVQLPFAVDPERAEARCVKGVLYLALRRPDEQKPKKITVKAA